MTDASEQPLEARIAKGAAWIVAARLVVRSIGLISTLVLARLLLPEDFGLVAIGLTMMQFLANLSDIGASQMVVKYRDSSPRFLGFLFTLSAIRGACLTLILFALSFFADDLFNTSKASDVFLGICLAPLVSGLLNPKFHEFERDLDFSKTFKLQAIAKIAGVATSIVVALIFRNFWAIIIATLVTAVVETALSYILRPYRPQLILSFERELLGLMGWLTGTSFFVALNNKLDMLLLPRLTSVGATGSYYVGHQLVDLATVEVSTPFAKALYPGLSETQEDPEKMRQTFLRGVEALAAVALPLAFGCAFVADDLVTVLLGQNWSDAALVLKICGPAEGLLILMLALQGYAIAANRTKLIFVREVVFFCIRTPIFVWAAFNYGLIGAIWASAAGSAVRCLFGLAIYGQVARAPFFEPLWRARRSFLGVAAMAVYFYFVKAYLPDIESWPALARLTLDGCIGAAFYLGAHFSAWLAAGRPAGIEQALIKMAGEAEKRFLKARPQ